jgi:hypothetical protein
MNKHGTGYFEDDEVSIDALRTVQAEVVKVNLLVDGCQGGLMTLTKGLMEAIHKVLFFRASRYARIISA